ncbi:MAG: 50S ribosomal protein L33 [bacterium]
MAKKGTRLSNLPLECSKCGRRNYVSSRSNIQPVKKLDMKKFCQKCKEHTQHKESK